MWMVKSPEWFDVLVTSNAIEDAVKKMTGTWIKRLSAGKMGCTTSEVGDIEVGYIQA